MSSIRYRNGRYYWRKTIRDQNGVRHWLEHGGFDSYDEALEALTTAYPQCKPFPSTPHITSLIFERFPEKHPAHVPLKILYYTDLTLEEAYDMQIDDLYLEKGVWKYGRKERVFNSELTSLLKRQINRIIDARLLYLYPDDPKFVNLYLDTGKKINSSQIYYVRNVIRREINPLWSLEGFKSQGTHGA